jgi:hypothetical protein
MYIVLGQVQRKARIGQAVTVHEQSYLYHLIVFCASKLLPTMPIFHFITKSRVSYQVDTLWHGLI